MGNVPTFLKKPSAHLILIAILGILVYSNTLHAPFVWDDKPLIVENKNIMNLSNYTDISGTRYLTYLSLAINYKLCGYDVRGYHVFNIGVHILNAVLLYLLVINLFKAPALREASGHSRTLALLSSLIFVSHPVHTQAVTYVIQRSALLATFFCLASVVLFIKARLNYPPLNPPLGKGGSRGGVSFPLVGNPSEERLRTNRSDKQDYHAYSFLSNSGSFLSRKHLPYYLLSVLSMTLAMKTKEIAFTSPFIILLLERIFFKQQWGLKKSILYVLPLLLTLLIIPLDKPHADVFTPSSGHFGVKGSVFSGVADETSLSQISRKDYMLTGMRAVLTYVRLFFLPVNLNYDYDYPVFNSFFNPEVFLSFIFIFFLLGLAVYLFIRRQTPLNPPLAKGGSGGEVLISFGILWLFITLSLESFVVVLNAVIFEYRLYLPSIGIVLVLVGISAYLKDKLLPTPRLRQAGKYVVSGGIIAVIAFSGLAYARNNVLKNELRLWEDTVRKSPGNARAHNNLGLAYLKKGMLDNAIRHSETALEINPEYAQIYLNLGNAYALKGLTEKARVYYEAVVSLEPDFAEAHNNLGMIYRKLGLTAMAVEHYRTAIRLKPELSDVHRNLGVLYLENGDMENARKEFEEVLHLNPVDHDAQQLLDSTLRYQK